MKNTMKNTFHKSTFLVALALSFFFAGCSDYLDVDTDTDRPVAAPINQLLPNVQLGVRNFNDYQFYSAEVLSVYTHQFTTREDPDQYGARPSNTPMTNEWDNVYLTLTDIETLIATASESTATSETGDQMYVGVAQILKAYLMSSAVDLWGDVPFSEATQLEQGIVSANFDDQQEIYQGVLDLIDSGKANIASEAGKKPGSEDLFYGGNMAQWTKFANTLKLKLYNQIKTTSIFSQSDFDALVTEDNFFKSSADDFQFDHTANQSPTDERNRLFVSAYGSTQFGDYQSPWFYEILKGMNPNIFKGIEDPRIPYYFVNQLQEGELPPDQGNATTGDPNADYWDASTGFYSIRFGSIGPDRDHAAENSTTYPGIFPSGGFYDDKSGPTIDITTGTGVAPHRILTYDEFLYIQAELINAGLMTGSASDKLKEAMVASFAKVDEVVRGTGTSQVVPVLSGSEAVIGTPLSYIEKVIVLFDGASSEKQLEIIMTQKWVSTFGDSMDQYTDYRRTGYPVLANPVGSSPEYQLNNNDGFPLDDEVTVQNNAFQLSIFWPQSELNLNQNAPAQKNPATYTIFWDN